MTKLNRLTGKLFGETATATGDNPQVGQFGSGLAGTYVGTTDVATIQNLTAWSNGFIGCVTPNEQFPPLPEMTGFGKVLSYQENYILQQGIPEWDNATDYHQNGFCSYNGIVYKSLTNNNLNNNPSSSTANWEVYGAAIWGNIQGDITSQTDLQTALSLKTNTDLSNLSSTGNARLHALKGYEDAGELLTDAEGLADVTSYANSSVTGIDTIKADNYTVVGSPTITNDGIASGFDDSNYISTSGKYTLNVSNNPWEIVFSVTTGTNTTGYAQALLGGEANKRGVFLQQGTNGAIGIYLSSDGTNADIASAKNVMTNGYSKDILFRIKFTGTQYTCEYSLDGGATFQSEMTPISSTTPIYSGGFLYLGRSNLSNRCFAGSIDLNSFKIYVDGDLVYQPCLKIPYTQSKTGSKIVDSAYRYRVSDMYEQFGYAPYYTLSASDFTLPMGEIYGMIERNNYNGIVGQTIFSLDPLSHDNLHLLDGSLLQGSGVYKSFIDNYIKPLYSSQPSRFVTESAWQTSVNTYGVCGYYVYDSVNNTVRLPKVTGFVEGTLTASALGQLTEAGLPNITGNIGGVRNDSSSITPSGAISVVSSAGTFTSGGGQLSNVNFDASRSSSIYGNSSTVQPQSIKGYMYIVVANGATGYYPTNTSGIITDLNNKAAKSDVDGQWVYSKLQIADTVTWQTNTPEATYSLANYLPNDGYNYEVLFSGQALTGTTSGNYVALDIMSDIILSGVSLCEARTRTTSSIENRGNAIIPVGTGRYVKQYSPSSSNANGTYSLWALAYRRIGKNS